MYKLAQVTVLVVLVAAAQALYTGLGMPLMNSYMNFMPVMTTKMYTPLMGLGMGYGKGAMGLGGYYNPYMLGGMWGGYGLGALGGAWG